MLDHKDRKILAGILISIVLIVGSDLITDSREGVKIPHLMIELAAAAVAAAGFLILMKDFFNKTHQLQISHEKLQVKEIEAEKWKQDSKKYLEGLSKTIDEQLERWQLSQSEKEVALLLLKGLSLKEIAEIRKTTEKTARAQSVAVYSKSGLTGRSELAAFFLEDLLLPIEKS